MNLSVPPRQSHGQSWATNQGSKEGGTQGKPQPLVPIQKISQAQMEDRRKKGLCYTCDSKWVWGHVCSVPKLFLIEAIQEDVNTNIGELPQEEDDLGEFFLEEFPEISLNAIIGTPSPKTMRLVGIVQFHSLTILIDSGSTHNFLDVKFAASLGFKPLQGEEISVRVANGQKVFSPGSCKAVSIKLQGFSFQTDLFILSLVGCDMVLGIQWLQTLGPILWDFAALKMQFSFQGQQYVLQGIQQGPQVNMVNADTFKFPRAESKGVLLQLMATEPLLHSNPPAVHGPVQDLLQQFEDIFREPKGLPPLRSHDHAIPLQDGVTPVSVRPYRYPFYQKEEIEKIVKDLLKSGVIRPSHSPFSSPVLLVRKTDGT